MSGAAQKLEAGEEAHAETSAGGHRPPLSYEAASARVETIIRRLDSGEASLGETLELVKEGKTLIEYCAGELEAVSGALEELRLDELVQRLERESGGVAEPREASNSGDAGASGGAGESGVPGG